jgi:two-component system, chemotaxis family, response regulator WspF
MKIGIVNDSPIAVEALRRAVSLRLEHHVVWVASDGREAIEFCRAQTPDVVLMDLIMPVVDGVEATRQIMAHSPCAILVVTVDVDANAGRVYEALGAGALDAISTPQLDSRDLHKTAAALLAKIDQFGGVIGDRASQMRALPATLAITGERAPLVAIGASAGGPTALATLLAALPADFNAAIVIVQHVDRAFAAGMADWLNQQSILPVRLAEAGDRPQSGVVLLAGTNDHLHLATAQTLGYTIDPAEVPYRPSVDVFFQSVAQRWTGRAVGVLLTGMGRDGALGLLAMRAKGYYTIAQDEASSAVYGMPKAAAALDAAVAILPLQRIAEALLSQF